LDDFSDEVVCLLDRLTRLIDKSGLDLLPVRAIRRGLLARYEWRCFRAGRNVRTTLRNPWGWGGSPRRTLRGRRGIAAAVPRLATRFLCAQFFDGSRPFTC